MSSRRYFSIFLNNHIKGSHSTESKELPNANDLLETEMRKPLGNEEAEIEIAKKVDTLLESGADKNHVDSIRLAIKNGHVYSLHVFFIKHRSHLLGQSTVTWAVMCNQASVISFLANCDFNINFADPHAHNNTPAHFAAQYKKIDAIKALGKWEVNFESKNKFGLTPLELSLNLVYGESRNQLDARFEVFEALLNAGAYPSKGLDDFLEWYEYKMYDVLPIALKAPEQVPFTPVGATIGLTAVYDRIAREDSFFQESLRLKRKILTSLVTMDPTPWRSKVSRLAFSKKEEKKQSELNEAIELKPLLSRGR